MKGIVLLWFFAIINCSAVISAGTKKQLKDEYDACAHLTSKKYHMIEGEYIDIRWSGSGQTGIPQTRWPSPRSCPRSRFRTQRACRPATGWRWCTGRTGIRWFRVQRLPSRGLQGRCAVVWVLIGGYGCLCRVCFHTVPEIQKLECERKGEENNFY